MSIAAASKRRLLSWSVAGAGAVRVGSIMVVGGVAVALIMPAACRCSLILIGKTAIQWCPVKWQPCLFGSSS
ncbi:hypothetical protein ACFS07_01490 [Undibacterium arcticum]